MKEKSEEFMEMFNEIHDYMKEINNDSEGSFADLLNDNNNDWIIKQNKSFLDKVRKIRNTLVHNNKVVSIPSDYTYETLKEIRDVIFSPPKVDGFLNKEILVKEKNSSIIETIKLMKRNNYSQIPIVDIDEKYFDLLTNNTVARWIGDLEDEGGGRLIMNDTPVEEVLAYKENEEVSEFISKNSKLTDLIEKYNDIVEEGKKFSGFLITETGKSTQKLLGIITGWDIPDIYQNVNIR